MIIEGRRGFSADKMQRQKLKSCCGRTGSSKESWRHLRFIPLQRPLGCLCTVTLVALWEGSELVKLRFTVHVNVSRDAERHKRANWLGDVTLLVSFRCQAPGSSPSVRQGYRAWKYQRSMRESPTLSEVFGLANVKQVWRQGDVSWLEIKWRFIAGRLHLGWHGWNGWQQRLGFCACPARIPRGGQRPNLGYQEIRGC